MKASDFRILIVDDERSFLLLLTKILQGEGYSVKGVYDPESGLKALGSFDPHLVITDLKMPKMDGMAFMDEVRNRTSVDFIMITAFATVETAVDAMKRGAVDYITKPLRDPEQLRAAVAKIFDKKTGAEKALPPIEIIFAGIENVLREIGDVAPTPATVIIYGETGTGKSLIARVIHSMSGRSGPFVEINCAAIPDTLLESELFGYEKGAFTGAVALKKGKFEAAGDGTIFLDEVSEMSLALQAKFLRVLQDKTFERLGSISPLRTEARVIAATNRDLKELVKEKSFREDLYYRLNVFPVMIPPLRERMEHIVSIAKYLMEAAALRFGKKFELTDEDSRRLLEYHWPGNIRELENIIERAVIRSKGQRLMLPELDEARSSSPRGSDLKSIERAAIENALKETGGNRKKAAEMLGISLRTIQYRIKEYEIRE